jgi:hypothetical protein
MRIIERLHIAAYDKRVARAQDLAEIWLSDYGTVTDKTLAVATECAGDAGLMAMVVNTMIADNYQECIDFISFLSSREVVECGVRRA